MKKIALSLIIFLLIPMVISAEINVSVTDSVNNKLCISGDAPVGEEVTLVVLNDGKTEDDVKSGTPESVVYARTTRAGENGYNFNFTLISSSGGDAYKAIVSHGGQKQTKTFPFYSDNVKKQFLADINTVNIDTTIITRAFSMFNLSEDVLYKSADSAALVTLLTDLREENGGFSNDPNAFTKVLRQTTILNALNTDDETLFSADSKLLYADYLEIDELSEYSDYALINATGVENIKEKLLSGTYKNLSALKDAFKENIYLEILKNYHKLGSGHIAGYLEKYKTAYEEAGFNLERLNKVTNKNKVYSVLPNANAQSLSDLANIFNKKVADETSSKRPSGNGGSVATGSSAPIGYLPVDTNNDDASSDSQGNYSQSFTDVPQDFWAFEHINALAQKGIINGRGDDIFAPFDTVNRSEFVKMIVLALEMTPDESGCDFSDMQSSWAKSYVGAAINAGFVTGINEHEFAPDLEITREQAAAMIGRALKINIPEFFNVFTDDKDISDYAKGYVYALRNANIIDGRASNAGFAPKDSLSRAEAAKIISLIVKMNSERSDTSEK